MKIDNSLFPEAPAEFPTTLQIKVKTPRSQLVFLDEGLWFPDPATAIPSGSLQGLVAMGGDLSPPRMLLAYQSGIFPWSVNPITWWSPDPRAILELDAFHVPRSLKALLRKQPFRVTHDMAFMEVVEACAAPRGGRESTWITAEFKAAYLRLHEQGHAHSVECWEGEFLAGGIFGVGIGGFFAGESMFHRASNASKAALFHLMDHLRRRQFQLFDIQMPTPTTLQFGAISVPRDAYLRRLQAAVNHPCSFHGAP